jgi:hypothetical protein
MSEVAAKQTQGKAAQNREESKGVNTSRGRPFAKGNSKRQ